MDIIKIDSSVKTGKIKPLHGVCNSPLSFGGLTDLSRAWKRAGFPFARQHDNDWPHPITVDIPQIFRNFDADADDPANYDFINTDATIKAIIDCGAQVIYRLGTSIEHTAKKVYTTVPKDFAKWAQICVHIIRHYNEGWADGFDFGIKYWEIWNEADLNQKDMWYGTPEQYYDMYVTASKIIKAECPDVKVGGPALAGYGHSDWARNLLKKIREENAPLDFFSWHLYRYDVHEFRKALDMVCGYLDEYGFGNAELICDEWNYNPVYGFALENGSEEEECRKVDYYTTMANEVGAAFCAAIMCFFQNSRNDIATYYDGQPTNLWCGIFDRFGVPTKAYYSFCAFNELYKLGIGVKTENEKDGLYCIAAENGGRMCVLLSRYMSNADNVHIDIGGFGEAAYTVIRTDRLNTENITESGVIKDGSWEGYVPDNGIVLLSLQRI